MPIVESLIAASSGSISLLLLEITRDYIAELLLLARRARLRYTYSFYQKPAKAMSHPDNRSIDFLFGMTNLCHGIE